MKQLTVILLSWASITACSGDRGDGSPDDEPGTTACGEVTCQAGQYCSDARFSECTDGCLSNDNCAANQRCDTGAFFPTCQNIDPGPGPVDALELCRAACDHFQQCGLAAADAAGCRTDCGSLTADQQQAVGNCGDDECAAVPGCLGVDCLSNADCAGGQCVGQACL